MKNAVPMGPRFVFETCLHIFVRRSISACGNFGSGAYGRPLDQASAQLESEITFRHEAPEDTGGVHMSHTARGDQWSPYIDTPDHYGFFKFNNATLHSLSERDFEAIVDNDERWNALSQRMEDDFGAALDMFPFEAGEAEASADRNWIEDIAVAAGNLLKGTARGLGLSNIELPKRYFAIARAQTEQRFPGGRAHGDPGDGDLRDMIVDFRILFKRNFANYIVRKRFYQLASSLAFAAIVGGALLWRGGIAGEMTKLLRYGCDALNTTCDSLSIALATDACLVGIYIAGYILVSYVYRLFSEHAYHAYKNAQTESCKTLDKQAALRTKNLSNLISTLLPRIDKDQAELISRGRIKDWPERSRKWMLLVYWLGRRQETLERSTQLEIWLIRRAFYFYKIVGSVTNHLLLAAEVLILAAPAALIWWLHPSDLIVVAIGLGLALLLVVSQWRLTGVRWNTDLDLIQANIDVANWDRFEKVRLPERLADQVFRDKQYLLQREDWVAGKNR